MEKEEMNAIGEGLIKSFVSSFDQVAATAITPFPSSRKVYIEGSRADIRVPMREIRQTATASEFGGEKNPPIYVYDCSGPYTDPLSDINLLEGLPPLRTNWIKERSDTDVLAGLSSEYGKQRLADDELHGLPQRQ